MNGAGGMRAPRAELNKPIFPVWVTRMQDPGHGDAFVLVSAPSADQARFHVERMIDRDFRGFRNTAWTPPLMVDGLYYMRAAGVVFAAMPKKAPIIFDGG